MNYRKLHQGIKCHINVDEVVIFWYINDIKTQFHCRQGFITEKTPLNVLVEKYLPLELREEIIPMARANNVVTLKE